jgi:ubiquinone/menaquinone biosynthesis C-methylase UbiE
MDRRDFFNDLAGRWDEIHPAEQQAAGVLQGLALLGSLDAKAIVDVGCGTGVLAEHILPKLGAGTLIGIDFAEEMVKRARARFPDPRVTWMVCDVFDTGLASDSVDVVLCYNTLPHFPDRERVLREFVRWLRDGGRLLVWHDVGREKIAEIHGNVGGAIGADRLPPARELSKLMSTCGLAVHVAEESPTSYVVLAERPKTRA